MTEHAYIHAYVHTYMHAYSTCIAVHSAFAHIPHFTDRRSPFTTVLVRKHLKRIYCRVPWYRYSEEVLIYISKPIKSL